VTALDAPAAGRPDVRTACSWLFVPGDRTDRFTKAAASGADVVVCDLEDAVAVDAKATARVGVARWLAEGGMACVRVNAHGTPFHDDDLTALADAPGLVAVLVPKAEDPGQLTELSDRLGPDTAVVGLVESALGQYRVHELAGARGVARLAFGSIDLALDLGATDSPQALLLARSSLVLASRLAGLPAPVDGVTADLHDPAAVSRDTAAAAELGFGGKLCVHPRQVGPVNEGFRPTPAEVQAAQDVLAAAADGGAARVGGQMVDQPVIERARQVLQRTAVDPGTPRPPADIDPRT
jgi:citrate lyase subunit beta / citryl-CoA lyase